MTCGVLQYGATFKIDAKEIMPVLPQDKFMDRPNQIYTANEEGCVCLAGMDCTSVLSTLFEEGDEDKSVAAEVEKSGETVKVVQSGMDNRELTEDKGVRLMEMTQRVLKNDISEHMIERLIDVLVPQIREHCVEFAKAIVQKCLKQHKGEQVVELFVPQFWVGDVPVTSRLNVPAGQVAEETSAGVRRVSVCRKNRINL